MLQTAMSFIEDQEDVVSMSLTVVHNLMEKYEIEPSSVGRQAFSSYYSFGNFVGVWYYKAQRSIPT